MIGIRRRIHRAASAPRQELARSGLRIDSREIVTVIFPCSGLVSMVVALANRELIEIGIIGRESMLGTSVARWWGLFEPGKRRVKGAAKLSLATDFLP
jgi:hypothetical protein